MPDSSRHDTTSVARRERLQRLLFGGVYGTVLASSLASALDQDTGQPDPGYDALWIIIASLAAAAAHGYAHAVVHLTADAKRVTAKTVRSVWREWPLVAAVVPTVAVVLGAAAGWWSEEGAIDVALLVNTVALFGWGFRAARVAGRQWLAACRVGGVAVLIGLLIVSVNALSH